MENPPRKLNANPPDPRNIDENSTRSIKHPCKIPPNLHRNPKRIHEKPMKNERKFNKFNKIQANQYQFSIFPTQVFSIPNPVFNVPSLVFNVPNPVRLGPRASGPPGTRFFKVFEMFKNQKKLTFPDSQPSQ